jgi:hypothetical protein
LNPLHETITKYVKCQRKELRLPSTRLLFIAMGALCSADSSAAGPKRRGSLRKEQTARNLAINEKIKEALKLKIEEQKKLEHPITLERILLKFDKLNDVLGYVKDVFDQLSPDGCPLGADDLYKALQMLKGRSSKEEVDNIFHFSDLEQNTKVNLKEFVVALTVAIVLGNVDFGTEKVKLAASPRRASISSFFGHPKEVYEMLQLIISAYLIFDTQGVGYVFCSMFFLLLLFETSLSLYRSTAASLHYLTLHDTCLTITSSSPQPINRQSTQYSYILRITTTLQVHRARPR